MMSVSASWNAALHVHQLTPMGRSQCLTSNRPSRSPRNWTPSAINSRRSSLTGDLYSRPHRPQGAINNRPTAVAFYTALVNGQPPMVQFLNSIFLYCSSGKCPYFWRYPDFPKAQCSVGRDKPARNKSALSVHPFRYNIGM